MCDCNVYVRRGRIANRAGFDSLPATLLIGLVSK
nr:MAG TPA: hypothetical protein [Caudoviricetes sp.]